MGVNELNASAALGVYIAMLHLSLCFSVHPEYVPEHARPQEENRI